MGSTELRFSNEIGSEYDLFQIACPHHNEIQIRSVEILNRHFRNNTPLEVLEIGFGTGITTKNILESNALISLIAIDSELNMLKQAQEKVTIPFEDRVKFIIADALTYLSSQNDNAFDSVISVWTLHNIDNALRTEILQEIFRTLKPGGIFVNGDKIASSDPQKHQEHLHWQLQQFDIFETINRADLKTKWVEHYLEDEKPNLIQYENNLMEGLSLLGFKNIKITNRHYLDAILSCIK